MQAREAQAQSARADQQRQQAEGLVEFMLGDLRDKLEPVGRLDVLDAVASRALAYYAGQSADHLDADALGRRARALGQLAELEQLRARLPEAERLIDSALSITAALVRRFPQQAERLTEHGDTLARKASIRSELMHNAEAAIPLFQQVLDWQQRALALRPGDPKLQVRVADAWFGLGNNFVEMDRPAQALAPLNQALALALALPNVTTQPQLWRTVVDIRSTLGDVHYRLGQYTQAVAVLTPHWTALTQVPGGDEDRALQQRRAQGMNRLASSLLNLGELDAAERTSREVVSQYDELLALDPSNLGRLRDQCFQRLQWAEVRLAAHDRPGAQALLAQVVADLNRLLAVDPNAEHYQFSLKGWLYELQALAAPDDPAVAQAIQRWLDEVVPAFLARTPGLDERSRVRVAAVGMALGDLRAAQGRQAEATQQWQRAQQQVPAATGASAAAKGYRAQLELRLGDKAGAAALAAELQAAGYTSRNQKDLMRRLAG